jgi:hypothetical protein
LPVLEGCAQFCALAPSKLTCFLVLPGTELPLENAPSDWDFVGKRSDGD